MNQVFLARLLESPVALTIFVLTLITSIKAFKDPELKFKFVLSPYKIFRDKEYYRIFTSGLIHGDQMHLAFNMITYYFFAFSFERLIGHWQLPCFTPSAYY